MCLLFHESHTKGYSRSSRFNTVIQSMHLLKNYREPSRSCAIHFLNQTLSSQIQMCFRRTVRPRILIIQPQRILSLYVVYFCYEFVNSTHYNALQVRPAKTADVVSIINIARKYKIPVVPYSGATSLEGHFSGVSYLLRATIATEVITVPFGKYMFGYVRYESYPQDKR